MQDAASRSPAISPYLALCQVESVSWKVTMKPESPKAEPLRVPAPSLARLPNGPLAIRQLSLVNSPLSDDPANAVVLGLFDPESVRVRGISKDAQSYATLSTLR